MSRTRLVARIVHTRDHLRDRVLLLRKLRDDHVVLVVSGEREQKIRRALDARFLEHEQLRRVALHRLMLELRLESLEAARILLHERRLVASAEQGAHDVRAHLASACNQHVHG
jgi:hypothetical protein